MIAQGSIRFVLPPLLIGVIISFFNIWIGLGFIAISLYMIWFFRDPVRTPVPDENILYAAADGIIKEVRDEDNTLKIAIRMSPFNVHINRSPYAGKVSDIQYKPGAHRSVYFGGAEEKNEQNLISIKHENIEIDVLQITGAFARRIECWVNRNDEIGQGQKIGIIRFGSQTNMLFKPTNENQMTILPIVKVGQKVQAGITPVARLRRVTDE